MLSESRIDNIIKESTRRVINEGRIPSYDEPVFIGCTSPKDADVSVELGYNDYASSLFYVGGCRPDGYAALAAVVEYLVENGLIDYYAYDENDLEAYSIEDFVEVEGYYLPSWLIRMEQIVGNHGERNESLNRRMNKKTIRLTEADVQNMIKESVMNILRSRGQRLNEVMGWDLEKEDVEWVNDENDGTKPWLLGLWPGSGYLLTHYGVWAFRDEMEAVEKVVAYLDQEGQDAFFISDEDIERQRQENIQDGFSEEDAEAMIDEMYLYVDGTEYGASEPHYIYLENLKVKPYDESKFRN